MISLVAQRAPKLDDPGRHTAGTGLFEPPHDDVEEQLLGRLVELDQACRAGRGEPADDVRAAGVSRKTAKQFAPRHPRDLNDLARRHDAHPIQALHPGHRHG